MSQCHHKRTSPPVQPSSDVVTAKVSTDTTLRFTSRHFDMDVTVRVSSDGNVQSLLGALKHWQRLAAAGNEGEPNIPLDTHGWCRALMNARRNERRRDVDNSNDGLPAISSLSLDQNNDAIDGIAASETSTTASRSSLLSPPSNPFLPRPNSGSFEASSTDTAATLHHLTNLSDAAALHAIKERWVATQLKAREQEFMEWREVLVFAGTWNVNGKLVVGGELAAWLGCAVGGKMGRAEGDDVNGSDVPADILVLGFQEVGAGVPGNW